MNKLVAALEFYAEEKNYWETLNDNIFRTTAISEDRGKRAREALSEHRAEPSRCGCCGAEIAKEADVCPSCNIVQWDNRAIADARSNTAFEPEPSAGVIRAKFEEYNQRVIEKIEAEKYGMPQLWCDALDKAIAILKESEE